MSRLLEGRLDIIEFQHEKVIYECFFDFEEVGSHFLPFSTGVQLHEFTSLLAVGFPFPMQQIVDGS